MLATARRWLVRLTADLALAATFATSVLVALALHANLPEVRRLAAVGASRALSGALRGRVDIAPFEYIRFRGLQAPQATLYDTYGRRVLTLRKLRVGFDPVLLAEELLSSDQALSVIVHRVRVEQADAEITPDPTTGEPTIVGAFNPRAGGPSTEPGTGRPLRLFLPSIEVGAATLHAVFRDVPPLEADVRSVHGQLVATNTGIAVDVTRFGAVLRGFGADARGTGTLAVRAPGATRTTFEGFFGDIELSGAALVKGAHVELSADIPSAAPSAVQRFLPDWPLVERVSAHVEAKGEFPELRARATVAAGRATATVEGPILLGEKRHATLKFSGEHMDVRVLWPRAPATDVGVEGDIDAENTAGAFSASVRAHTGETEVDGFPIPALDAEATINDGVVSGAADIHEPGMPTHATFHVSKAGAIDVEAEAKAVDFRKIRKLPQYDVNGRGGARLNAHIENGILSASVEASAGNVDVSSVHFDGARVAMQAHGSLASPEKLQGSAHVTAKSVSRGAFRFDDVQFEAQGNLDRAAFEAGVRQKDGPQVALAGTLALSGHPLLRDTKISVKRDPVVVEGDISSFDPGSEELYVRSLRATGIGGPLTGSARFRPNLVELEAEGENLDLDALSRALALPRGTLGGRARVSLTLAAGRDITRGHLRLGAGNLTIGTVGGVSTEIFADLDDEHLTGGASGIVLGLGTFGASWDLTLGGPASQLASLQGATGKAELQLSDLELKRLDFILPEKGPVQGIEGRGYARIEFARDDSKVTIPDMKVTAATRGLAVVLKSAEPRRLDHVDIDASGHFDGENGEADGNTLLFDSKGDLASFTGSLRIDTRRLLADPNRAVMQLIDTPIEARASVPHRRIVDFPEILRIPALEGEINADLLVSGTLAHPTLRAGLDGRGVSAKGSGFPVDVHAEGQYDATEGALRGRADARIAQGTVATAVLSGSLPAGVPSDFRGSLRLDLDGLPFGLVGALSENSVRGSVFGTATLSAQDGGGALLADLRVADASVDRTPLGDGRLHVVTDSSSVSAKLTFSGARGQLDAEGTAGLAWLGPVPMLSTGAPLRARVIARDFSAAAFSPVVSGVLSRVGGHVDANVAVALEPRPSSQAGDGWIGEVDGSAVLHDGTVLVDVLGLEIHNVGLRAQATGKGGTTHVTIADLKGSVRSSTENVHGSADLELEGLKLMRGNGAVYADDTPILFRGAPQGRATGNAALHLTREQGQMLVDVDVPTLALKLPESSARSVIDVSDNPEIVVLQNATQEERRSDALPWSLLIHLGNAVSIHRSDLDLKVTGTPVVSLGRLTQVGGSVELVPGGRVPVLGQVFVIERGTITFNTGVPENPNVNVTAVWRAPNDTLVYVEVTGTLRESEVALRSDPPLPEAEVFALLFGGGSSDDTALDPNSNAGGSAAGTAALQGPVQQLNRLFGQSPVELRVGSTSEAQSRYTAAVRVRENLWFEASTYQQSEYSGGSASNRSVVSGTIDYRFTRKWSLRTEAGTVGGALDLLWQHRY